MLFGYQKRGGFTVIEIFVTISVVAVISAISIYYYNDYVEDARKTVRITNEKLVNEAIGRYYKDYMKYPKYEWLEDSIEDIDKKINRGLDSSLSNYFANKKVSDILLEGSGTNPHDVFFLVSEPIKRDTSASVDNSTATETWKMAKNLRFANRDFLVHEVRIAEADSGITTSTFNNHEKFYFPLIHNSVPLKNTQSGYNTIHVDEELDIKMVAIPPGTFIMGSPSNELGRSVNESQHQVTISKQFLISKYEVTQKQYLKVMGTNPSNNKTNEFFPVENVSWNDAKTFCNRLNSDYSRLIPYGYKFDLPTEAQWEYACRAGTTTALNSGENLTVEDENTPCPNLAKIAWYKWNSGNKAHQVGQLPPNAWGLYDMHGNVLEFCLDKRDSRNWRIDYPLEPITDPTGPDLTSNFEYIIRGGSFQSGTRRNRSAYRDGKAADRKEVFVGIRVVLVEK
ncbi:MAG: SUMF1/EgtB/PvdO family nonheme iron enzyme [Candidatus Riflebacteria bacterium]|nr:SUMF1/EgtB/PvdO family nonheme iron enzyme [Candidatus Riflebacteria bacterium]